MKREPETTTTTAPLHGRRRLAAYAAATILAGVVLTGVVLVVVMSSAPESNAASTASEPAVERAAIGVALFPEFHATLVLTPGAQGENRIDISLSNHDGGGAPDLGALNLRASLPSEGIGPLEYAAAAAGTMGGYVIESASLPSAGDWELTLEVRVDDGDQLVQTVAVPIGKR